MSNTAVATKPLGRVISSSSNAIIIGVQDHGIFEENKDHLQIGKYLNIKAGNLETVIAIIKNLKAKGFDPACIGENQFEFCIECQPIGMITDNVFHRGTSILPIPTEEAFIAEKDILDKIYVNNEKYNFPIGTLVQNRHIDYYLNGDSFFSKHIGVVGSTGSGKSCAVASILQNAIGIEDAKNINKKHQKNSHIIIFDIHSEYKAAFSLIDDEKFNLNIIDDLNKMKLPYWLMNSEELESMFIESNEQNSHNQISIFKQAVILNKEKYNPEIKDITYDTPVYFSIKEIYNYIENMNREVISKLNNENCPKLEDNTLVHDRKDYYFNQIYNFVPSSTAAATKATNGPFNPKFDRFVSRLETTLTDKRLKFLIDPRKENDTVFETKDFEEIVKQFLGYNNKSNITVVDLSGVPFEVLSITVSLISRILFDFCFHYSKIKHQTKELNDIPVLIVCEEAHNYIPRSENAAYRSSKKSLERIAKEGRKYGMSLMVVSQRPSEVSDTIFSQCNNFIALRLTNPNDQSYIKNLLPDNIGDLCNILPNLGPGEAIVMGDATIIPAIVQIELPSPQPHSETVDVLTEWKNDWKDVVFKDIISKWRKENFE